VPSASVWASGAQPHRPPDIVQPRIVGREGFMERAYEMRRRAIERGDQPYGAVIVRGDRIVGEGVSGVVTDNDPTAHAEMQAIRDAARRLGTDDLTGCELYGTSRACPMCEAGAYRARIVRMRYGTSIADAGAPRLR
jgi:tRNA(Arg) A34 adenosine deaminase TadA